MMDSDPDNTAEPGAITRDWDDGADGPQCRTADALACLMICFTGTETTTSLHRHCYCLRAALSSVPPDPVQG